MSSSAKRRQRYSDYERVPSSAYDGSAVRQLEQPAEVPQTRPLVRPRERAVVRPRIQVREAGKISIFAVAGFWAIGVFAVLLLFSSVQLHTISDQVAALHSEMLSLQSEEAVLRAKYEQVYDLSTIEQEMISTGRMVKPQSGQIIYVDMSEPDSVTLFDREEAATGTAGAFQSIKSICGEILEYFN